jgi:hypothetical protein
MVLPDGATILDHLRDGTNLYDLAVPQQFFHWAMWEDYILAPIQGPMMPPTAFPMDKDPEFLIVVWIAYLQRRRVPYLSAVQLLSAFLADRYHVYARYSSGAIMSHVRRFAAMQADLWGVNACESFANIMSTTSIIMGYTFGWTADEQALDAWMEFAPWDFG